MFPVFQMADFFLNMYFVFLQPIVIFMNVKNQYLKEIVPHLKEKYGAEKAEVIITSAWTKFEAICAENAGEPKAYDMHTKERIYPAIACLRAMTEAGVEWQESIDFLHSYYLWRAEGKAKVLRKMMKIPGLYKIMPKLFKKLTPNMFGEPAGFQSVWHEDSEWDLSFDMVKCPYQEKCAAYGCPELCSAYCDADDVCYGDMHPKVVWGRTKTLGKGGDCCDFRMKVVK